MNPKKEKELKELEKWNNYCLHLNLESESAIADLYESYCQFIIENIGSIPLTQKTFVTNLKNFLSEQVSNNKVKFFYKKGSKVLGINIKK